MQFPIIHHTPNYDGGEQTWLLYLDVNNFYGKAMMDVLPMGNYKWCNFSDEAKFLQHAYDNPDDSPTGYILEVDMIYPQNLHDDHNDFPLAPHRMKINQNMLSPYASQLAAQLAYNDNQPHLSDKLISTFLPRHRYVLHYRNLKYYIDHGLHITKVYRAISFRQRPWLKPYIDFCTQKRRDAPNPFVSSLYKLFANSIYGKLMEDKRKHVKVDVVLKECMAERRVRKDLCQRMKILAEDKIIFQMKPDKVIMDKAVVSGFTVLELSKLHVYSLYYDHFKSYYGKRIQLIYSDTDSLLVEIKSNDIVNDMKHFDNIMDFGDLPRDHPLYSPTNSKKIGCLKDEMAGDSILEVVAIKPKLYAIKSVKGEKKRAKGIQKVVCNNQLSFEDYKKSLYEESVTKRDTRRLGSLDHKISMFENCKIAISPFEDKRYLCNDKITSYAYGHYLINQ